MSKITFEFEANSLATVDQNFPKSSVEVIIFPLLEQLVRSLLEGGNILSPIVVWVKNSISAALSDKIDRLFR